MNIETMKNSRLPKANKKLRSRTVSTTGLSGSADCLVDCFVPSDNLDMKAKIFMIPKNTKLDNEVFLVKVDKKYLKRVI